MDLDPHWDINICCYNLLIYFQVFCFFFFFYAISTSWAFLFGEQFCSSGDICQYLATFLICTIWGGRWWCCYGHLLGGGQGFLLSTLQDKRCPPQPGIIQPQMSLDWVGWGPLAQPILIVTCTKIYSSETADRQRHRVLKRNWLITIKGISIGRSANFQQKPEDSGIILQNSDTK